MPDPPPVITPSAPERLSRLRRAPTWALRGLAVFGALVLCLLAVGVALDYRSFDRTSGGYDPPHDDWTGTPIDWESADRTVDGFRLNGRVIDYGLDCTSGMVTFWAFGVGRDWRVVSPRAIAVHRPREACAAAGYSPRF